MMKRLLFGSALLLALFTVASAQVTVPNTLVDGTTITAGPLNTNFSTIANHALDRLSGGNISGTITVDSGVTIDGIDIGATVCNTCTPTFGALTLTQDAAIGRNLTLPTPTTGVTVAGNTIINTLGKIPALTSSYIAALAFDVANLTGNFVATVGSGTGITSSVTTGTGAATTISLNNTAVTPATYGSATAVPVLTIDQQGRVTAASTTASPAAMLLLHRGSGTGFTSSSTIMDSFAVSGLTAFDVIKVIYTFNNPTGAFGATLLNSTDGVTIQGLNNVNTTGHTYETMFSIDGTNTKKVFSIEYDFVSVATGTSIGSTFVTDWTGTWTLALKSIAGITGSTSWTWRVYKVVGQ